MRQSYSVQHQYRFFETQCITAAAAATTTTVLLLHFLGRVNKNMQYMCVRIQTTVAYKPGTRGGSGG